MQVVRKQLYLKICNTFSDIYNAVRGRKTVLKVSVSGFSFTSFLSTKKKKGLYRKGKAWFSGCYCYCKCNFLFLQIVKYNTMDSCLPCLEGTMNIFSWRHVATLSGTLIYHIFCMPSPLNISIHVLFKAAQDLYFLWYIGNHWPKPRQLSGYKEF